MKKPIVLLLFGSSSLARPHHGGSAEWGQAMVRQLLVLALLSSAAIGAVISVQVTPRAGQGPSSQDHVAWVAQTLKQMQTIKPGMTRMDLLKVFTTEGGLSIGLRRTFVSRECPYFKVDVEFEAVGHPSRDVNGRVTLVEGSQDIIVNISRPYLQFSVTD
jgi:hypothetical protein